MGVGAGKILEELNQLVAVHQKKFPRTGLQLGPVLTFDSKTEQFTGEHADAANKFLRVPGREEVCHAAGVRTGLDAKPQAT